MLKKLLLSLFILFLLFSLVIQFYLKPKLPVINGYAAHMACSCYYLANRSIENIQLEDLSFFPMDKVSISHNESKRSFSATLLGLGKKTAVYKDDLGCMLLKGKDDYLVKDLIDSRRSIVKDTVHNLPLVADSFIDRNVQDIIQMAFDSTNQFVKKTRAVLVIHKDTLIGEHYSEGIGEHTPLLGWSMTKSLANAFIGVLVKDSLLSIDDTFKETNWEDSVSLNHLLQMSSGIQWAEIYDEVSLATRTLYDSEISAHPMMESQTEYPPGTHWEYSSGTSNYLSKIIKEAINDDKTYQNLPYDRLFKPIGASSFIIEMDESGHYIMSSYGYASARDWSKFGLLYLHDGVWADERILPEGWVDYSVKPNGTSPEGQYGSQIWLNSQQYVFPSIPKDAYVFNGFQGQHVVVIPSEKLVVVRLGLEKDMKMMDRMIASIIKELKT